MIALVPSVLPASGPAFTGPQAPGIIAQPKRGRKISARGRWEAPDGGIDLLERESTGDPLHMAQHSERWELPSDFALGRG